MDNNNDSAELLDLLDKVQSPGRFCAHGSFTSVAPGLTVNGLGPVSLPVVAAQAKALIEMCEQAPFGRGEETVTDTSVRNCWQLDASLFELRNPQYHAELQKLVSNIAFELGLVECEVVFEPYKLLIYEEGSFFVRHRDTEKMPSMFATLVVGLPSAHQGGELVVSHGGESEAVSFANNDDFCCDYAAFYADCYHEVKPVTSGYRVCLVYNLAIKNRAEQPLYQDTLAGVSAISSWLASWCDDPASRPLMTYLLDHSYSDKNLSFDNLKNGDYYKAQSLLTAAKQSDCEAYLCLVTYHRESYGELPYRRWGDEADEDDFEEFDVGSEEIVASGFIAQDGVKQVLGELTLEEADLFAKVHLFDGPGEECHISEATGNAGATKELWYYRGAIILWPKARSLEVMLRADSDHLACYLAQLLEQGKLASDVERKALTPFIEKAIGSNLAAIEKVLLAFNDLALYQTWLERHLSGWHLPEQSVNFVKQMAQNIGWSQLDEKCSAALARSSNGEVWLNHLLKTGLDSEGMIYVAKWLMTMNVVTRDMCQMSCALQNMVMLRMNDRAQATIAAYHEQTSDAFLSRYYGPAVVDAVAAMAQEQGDNKLMQLFVCDLLERITKRFPKPIDAPRDWAREGQLHCSCEVCAQVNHFLSDKDHGELTINAFKKDLIHAELNCRQANVDLDVTIDRAPKKFLGTFVKNQNRFKRQFEAYSELKKIEQALQMRD